MSDTAQHKRASTVHRFDMENVLPSISLAIISLQQPVDFRHLAKILFENVLAPNLLSFFFPVCSHCNAFCNSTSSSTKLFNIWSAIEEGTEQPLSNFKSFFLEVKPQVENDIVLSIKFGSVFCLHCWDSKMQFNYPTKFIGDAVNEVFYEAIIDGLPYEEYEHLSYVVQIFPSVGHTTPYIESQSKIKTPKY